MKNTEWGSITLPSTLLDAVRIKVSKKGSTYSSISDYVSEKVRQGLEDHKCR